jgi:hypothetical protein
LFAALLLVAALLIGSAAYLTNYMPLIPANGSGGGLGGRDLGGFVSPVSEESFNVTEYIYQRGARFWFGFGLRNKGPLGVTVTAIDSRLPSTERFHGLAQQSGVWMGKRDGWLGPPRDSGGEAFRPFWLGPGQERWVVIEIQFWDCPPEEVEGGSLTQYLLGAHLNYRVLGIPRYGFMPYDSVIHLTGPDLVC